MKGEPIHRRAIVRWQGTPGAHRHGEDAPARGADRDPLNPLSGRNGRIETGEDAVDRDGTGRRQSTSPSPHPESSSGTPDLNAFTTATEILRSRDRLPVMVLAGGRSARFGRDKLSTPISGRPSLARVISRVAPLASDLVVSTASESRRRELAPLVRSDLSWSVDRDDTWGPGPAGAMARHLADRPGTELLIVPGDVPWIETAALRRFVERARRADVDTAVPAWSSGETEHLIQWHRGSEAAVAVRDAVRGPRGTLRASEFLRAVPRTLVVPISRLTTDPGTFAHLTYPGDAVRRRWRGAAVRSARPRVIEGSPKASYAAAHRAYATAEFARAERAFIAESRWYAGAVLPLLARHAEDDARATVNRGRRLRRSR